MTVQIMMHGADIILEVYFLLKDGTLFNLVILLYIVILILGFGRNKSIQIAIGTYLGKILPLTNNLSQNSSFFRKDQVRITTRTSGQM